MIRYMIYMQILDFKFKFKLCVMHLMVKVYARSVYRRLIFFYNKYENILKQIKLVQYNK